MARVEVAGCRLFVCFYVAPPQESENARETGEGEALVLNTVLFKTTEEALVLNTVLFKPAEETTEQTQRRALFQMVCMSQSVAEIAEPTQRKALFRRVCMSHGQPCTLIIDNGSTNNLVAREMVEKLGLKRLKHPTPYRVSWLQEGHQLLVDEQCEVEFHIDQYKDKVICDIMSMDVCDILLGRPWQYDTDVVYFGKITVYKVYKDGINHKIVPIKDEETAGTSETRSPFLKQVESPKEKVTDIKPTTEKATEEEVPVSNPVEEVPAAAKTVDEIPATVEKSAEESTVTPPASEPEAESGLVESVQVKKPKEESAPAAKEAKPAKEETVAQPPAEAAAVEENAEESSDKEEALAAIETAAEEKAEESLVKEEAPAEISEEKTATVEESVVKRAEAAPAEEKAEVERKAEE